MYNQTGDTGGAATVNEVSTVVEANPDFLRHDSATIVELKAAIAGVEWFYE